jgi:LCP family protein required for cell wall assembly
MNDLIRQAIAAEAEERVDSRTVLAELHKRKKSRKPFGLIVGVATLTAAAAAAAVIIPATIKKTEAAPATQPPAAAAVAQNVLLIGTDDTGNTDALVFARFEGDGSAVSVVSLPRDVFMGTEKINGLFRDNPAKLTTAVQSLTGAKVDHYAAIRMSEFGRIAQLVGGVEVCLSAPAKDKYSGVDLPAGRQTIAGEQALAFLRQRHQLEQGDLDRARRHQVFLAGLAAKITKDNALALARGVGGSIKVDDGWDVLEFAQRFQGPLKIRAATLPVGEPAQRETGFGFEVDPAQAKQFVEKAFAGDVPAGDECAR